MSDQKITIQAGKRTVEVKKSEYDRLNDHMKHAFPAVSGDNPKKQIPVYDANTHKRVE